VAEVAEELGRVEPALDNSQETETLDELALELERSAWTGSGSSSGQRGGQREVRS
jgi:hypothetical protein